MTEPMKTAVGVIQDPLGRWHVWLTYHDGDEFVSTQDYASEKEAETAGLKWALANHVPEGRPS